jgi:hypothetical protein
MRGVDMVNDDRNILTRYTVLYSHKTSLSRTVTNFYPHQVYFTCTMHTRKISSKLLALKLTILSFYFQIKHLEIFARSKPSSVC